jgi:hypothetical protein
VVDPNLAVLLGQDVGHARHRRRGLRPIEVEAGNDEALPVRLEVHGIAGQQRAPVFGSLTSSDWWPGV